MKLINLYKTLAFTIIFGFSTASISAQATQKIGGDSYNIHPGAILELQSDSKGFLLPRMTKLKMDDIFLISSPQLKNDAKGMMVYCTTCGTGELRMWDGTQWGMTITTTGLAKLDEVEVATTLKVAGTTSTSGITNTGTLGVTAATTLGSTLGVTGVATFTAQPILSSLTVSQAVFTDGSKGLVSNAITGTGNVVMSDSPIFTGTPTLPTGTIGVTQTAADNTTKLATTAFVTGAVVTSLDGLSDAKVGGTGFTNSMIIGHQTTGDITGAGALYNTGVGFGALQAISNNGAYNTAVGYNALNAVTSTYDNTAFGSQSLLLNTGTANTAIGNLSLSTNTTGDENTAIGASADVDESNGILRNATAIGYSAIVDASNKIQLGNSAVTAVKLGATTAVTLETGLIKLTGGTPASGKILTSDANGLASWTTPAPAVTEFTDEYNAIPATANKYEFSSSKVASTSCLVKMYINGVRISNTAYTIDGTRTFITYNPANNGNYVILASDRVQLDYSY